MYQKLRKRLRLLSVFDKLLTQKIMCLQKILSPKGYFHLCPLNSNNMEILLQLVCLSKKQIHYRNPQLLLISFTLGDWNEIGVGSSINLTTEESIQVPELEIITTP